MAFYLGNCAPSQETFGNVWGHFWLCYWHLVGRDQNIAKHCTMHRVAPATKNHLAPKVNSGKIEKPWSKSMLWSVVADSKYLNLGCLWNFNLLVAKSCFFYFILTV